jgi:hypothetical protein
LGGQVVTSEELIQKIEEMENKKMNKKENQNIHQQKLKKKENEANVSESTKIKKKKLHEDVYEFDQQEKEKMMQEEKEMLDMQIDEFVDESILVKIQEYEDEDNKMEIINNNKNLHVFTRAERRKPSEHKKAWMNTVKLMENIDEEDEFESFEKKKKRKRRNMDDDLYIPKYVAASKVVDEDLNIEYVINKN